MSPLLACDWDAVADTRSCETRRRAGENRGSEPRGVQVPSLRCRPIGMVYVAERWSTPKARQGKPQTQLGNAIQNPRLRA